MLAAPSHRCAGTSTLSAAARTGSSSTRNVVTLASASQLSGPQELMKLGLSLSATTLPLASHSTPAQRHVQGLPRLQVPAERTRGAAQ